MTQRPQRKPNRLKGFDYSTEAAYFITICTQKRQCCLGSIVGASIARPPRVTLSHQGEVVVDAIREINNHYPSVVVEKYVIMPNHIHLIMQICADADERAMLTPTISTVVQHLKGYVTRHLGASIWQKSFHDHIIRAEHDYRMIWECIDTNPYNGERDCFYQP